MMRSLGSRKSGSEPDKLFDARLMATTFWLAASHDTPNQGDVQGSIKVFQLVRSLQKVPPVALKRERRDSFWSGAREPSTERSKERKRISKVCMARKKWNAIRTNAFGTENNLFLGFRLIDNHAPDPTLSNQFWMLYRSIVEGFSY